MSSKSLPSRSPSPSPLVVLACEDVIRRALDALDEADGIEAKRLKRLQRAQEEGFRAVCPADALQLLVEAEEDNHRLQNLVGDLFKVLQKKDAEGFQAQARGSGSGKDVTILEEEHRRDLEHNAMLQSELNSLKQLVHELKTELCLTQSRAWEMEATQNETLDQAVALLESPALQMACSLKPFMLQSKTQSNDEDHAEIDQIQQAKANGDLQALLAEHCVEMERMRASCGQRERSLQERVEVAESQNLALRSEISGLKNQIQIVKTAARTEAETLQKHAKALAAELLEQREETERVREQALQIQQKTSQVVRQFLLVQQFSASQKSPPRSLPEERDAFLNGIQKKSAVQK